MKSHVNKIDFKTIKRNGILLFLVLISYSCIKDQQVYEVFKGDMVYSFLKKDTSYSEYVKIIDKSGLKGMLSAYGSYTCLAPSNAAFKSYYASFGKRFTIDSLRQGQIDTIARTHIVGSKFLISNLNDGVIPYVNMNQRYIEIKFTTDPIKNSLKIVLNDSSQIMSKDNEVYNGVVHGLSHVLKPSNALLPGFIANNPKISIFSEALKLTHMSDSISLIKDLKYKAVSVFKDIYDKYQIINPSERKYGYTVLIESDQLFKSKQINNIHDLIALANQLYPSGKGFENDFTDRRNSLNQYISYHILEKTIFSNNFFYTSHTIKNYTPDEYLETMLENRIIKASKINSRIVLNPNSLHTARILENESHSTVNGVYHLLDNMLVYNDNVELLLQNSRIRFDFAALFPELTNNNMRCSRNVTKFANGDEYCFEPGYLKYVKTSKDTRIFYLSGYDDSGWMDFQGDDLVALGSYDVTMRLLPVPPGTYEIRFGYTANGNRSITQIYVDNKPIGIPLDLKIPASDPKIGWESDATTDDSGFENDKMMRNRGYMKGPNIINSSTNSTLVARDLKGALRLVIGTFTFSDYRPHYIRFKSVVSDPLKQLQLDYMEIVSKNVYNPPSGEPESRD